MSNLNRLERIEKEAYTMSKVECKHCHKKFHSRGVRIHEYHCRFRGTVTEAIEPIQKPNASQQLHDAVQVYWNQLTLSEQIRAVLFLREGE